MTKESALAAWRGDAPPDDLPAADRLPFLMLRATYHAYRAGAISQAEGEHIKRFLDRYPACTPSEQRTLLQYAFAHLSARAGQGDMAALADSRELARAHYELTGAGPSGA